jgi:hypothetical protein
MSKYSSKQILDFYFVERLSIQQIKDITKKNSEEIKKTVAKSQRNTAKLRRVSVRRRNRTASLLYLGSKCSNCGYNKCEAALEFHHFLQDKKSFNISSGFNLPWRQLKEELDKCMLLCCNCHREFHYNEKSNKK